MLNVRHFLALSVHVTRHPSLITRIGLDPGVSKPGEGGPVFEIRRLRLLEPGRVNLHSGGADNPVKPQDLPVTIKTDSMMPATGCGSITAIASNCSTPSRQSIPMAASTPSSPTRRIFSPMAASPATPAKWSRWIKATGTSRADRKPNHEFNTEWLRRCQRVLKPNGTIWVTGTHHVIFSIG